MKYVVALGALLLVPALTLGATMSLTSGGFSSRVIAPGLTFPVLISVDTQGALLAGYSVKLHAVSGGSSLQVSGYSIIPNLLPALGTLNGNLATDRGPAGGTDNVELLDPNGDLLDPPQFENLGPGIITLATFNVTLNAAYAGPYPLVLELNTVLLSDENGQPLPVNSLTSLGRLDCTPEPVSLMLLGVGGVMLRRRR